MAFIQLLPLTLKSEEWLVIMRQEEGKRAKKQGQASTSVPIFKLCHYVIWRPLRIKTITSSSLLYEHTQTEPAVDGNSQWDVYQDNLGDIPPLYRSS